MIENTKEKQNTLVLAGTVNAGRLLRLTLSIGYIGHIMVIRENISREELCLSTARKTALRHAVGPKGYDLSGKSV
jgi:hypothetical protein